MNGHQPACIHSGEILLHDFPAPFGLGFSAVSPEVRAD